MKNLDHYLEKAVENIESDREVTKELLDDVMRYVSKNEQHHKEVGAVAAKYVETLQRSNEQLVKVGALVHKKEQTSVGLSDFEREEIFDLINNSEQEEQENAD